MKLTHAEALAADIEHGLGEVDWMSRSLPSRLRLSQNICGIVSIALSEQLRQQGYDVELVLSVPEIKADPLMQHVVPVVHHEGIDTIIDATYTQFLEFAGLHPGYVMFGGEDSYPDGKIVTFEVGSSEDVVTQLTTLSRQVMNNYKLIPEVYPSMEFKHFNNNEIAAQLTQIWNPDNFTEFTPRVETTQVGQKLASFILPEHVHLVA